MGARKQSPGRRDAGSGVRLAGLLLILAAALLLRATWASADLTVCTPSGTSGPLTVPKCSSPRGLATDFETGRLYVADTTANRIDVFEEEGRKAATPANFGGVTAPVWIAVDNIPASASHHDVYVTQDFEVKKFSPTGTLLGEFGEQGDGTPEGCQVEREDDPIAVGPEGDIYLADSYNTTPDNPETSSIWENRVIKLDSAGACVGVLEIPNGVGRVELRSLAVDSSGVVSVHLSVGPIRQYSPTGILLNEISEKGTINAVIENGLLAIDADDDLIVRQGAVRVTKLAADRFFTVYDPVADGSEIKRRFGYGPGFSSSVSGLAALHTPAGDVFDSNESTGVTYHALPDPGPVLFPEPCKVRNESPGSVRAVLQAEVNPEGEETSFHFEFMTQKKYEEAGNKFVGFSSAPATVLQQVEKGKAVGPATDFELHEAAQTVEPLTPETEYRCRVVATNAESGPEGTVGEEGTFTTSEPFGFGPEWASAVGEAAATINAEGNPNGAVWTAQVEYVSDTAYQESGFAEALRAPSPPLEYAEPKEEHLVLQSAPLSGLTPGTLYHYRLRVFNPEHLEGLFCPGGAASCPALEHTFRTYAPEEAHPDNRAYELVSPGQKNSADVVGPSNTRGLFISVPTLVIVGASSGEAVTYTSWTSFGAEAEGAPATSQYLSTRTPDGWQTANISPGGFQKQVQVPPYIGFSPDLGFGAFEAGKTSLASGCPAGHENLYLQESSGEKRCLTTEEPGDGRPFGNCFGLGGISADGSRVFFRALVAYAGVPGGSGYRLYEAHEGQVRPISILPGQTQPAPPATAMTSFGARTAEDCHVTNTSIVHGAISADGSHAVWTYVTVGGSNPSTELMDRIDTVEGAETVQLDRKQTGSGSGQGLFWAASTDGQVVYFTSTSRLLSGVKAEPGKEDLYRYDFSNPTQPLRDLTVKGTAPGDVRGVLGASADGSVVYYVAKSALTAGSEENEFGEHAEAGQNNLYVWDAEEGKNHFIARLSEEDRNDWESQPFEMTSRVTPDGQHIAFTSVEASELTASHYDNTLAATAGKFAGAEHCRTDGVGNLMGSSSCPEAFVYDAATAKLTCASCNPAGSRPLGPTRFPGWTNPIEGPRIISDDGQRLFFESYDRISDADENAELDVYGFEFAGSGTCTTSSSAYDPASGGCHYLVSSGRSPDESYLVDASAGGRDVFFSTRQALNGWDTNPNYDVYDYRENGGFAEPPVPVPPCEGETGCKPPAAQPPATSPSPGSTGQFPGNPKPPVHCKKGQVRRKGRCVAKPGHRKKHGHHSKTRHRGSKKPTRAAGEKRRAER